MTTPTKKQLLKKAYQHTMDVSILNMKAPIRWIDQYVSESVTGFGTAADEKVRSRKDYHKLIQDARNQSKAMPYKAVVKTAYRPKMQGENQAVFNDEILVSIGTKKNAHHITLWMSTVFQWADNKWQLVLFHGSMPNFNTSSEDTFHIEEAKKRVKELEQKVAEKTAELKERNRELEIETALERVRSRALAMHKTNELAQVVAVVFSELAKLNFNLNGGAIVLNLFHENADDITQWIVDVTNNYPYSFHHPHFNNPILNDIRNARKKGVDYFSAVYSYKVKNDFWNHYFKHTDFKRFPKSIQRQILNKPNYAQCMALEKHTAILNPNINGEILTEEHKLILKRFAKVFEQAYTRFLDLQKAESQAREAQIEAAMERVRARSMAMQKPEELIEVAVLLRKEMGNLGVEELETSSIYIIGKNNTTECWYALKDLRKNTSTLICDEMTLQLNETWVGKQMWQFYQSTKNQISIPMQGDNRKEWINYCASHSKVLKGYYGKDIPDRNYHLVKFNDGYIGAATQGDINTESWGLLKRAAAVFSLAYTRFKDLQEAAANAREARIELALERVRARTMAMHNSKDVGESVAAMFDELALLGVLTAEDRCGIGIMQPNEMMELWTAAKTTGKTELTIGYLNMRLHKLLKNVYRNWLDQKEMYEYILRGIDKEKYYEAMRNQENYKIKKDYYSSQEKIVHTDFFFKEGCLYVFSQKQFTDESISIFIRFTNVFGQTYRRYLDLQKAEVQAREAQIEASLEKVRSVAMSMHHSNELLNICEAIYAELLKLGITELRNTMINIHNDADETFLNYDYSAYGGRAVTKYGYHIHPIINHLVMQCRSAQDAFVDVAFVGEEFEAWRSFRKSSGEKDDKRLNNITHLHYYFYSIGIGSIGVSTFESIDEQKLALLKRFRNVFQLAYQRFTDLAAAEAQAREAQIETALERVRSRTMAMQKSSELADTVQIMFEEFRSLQTAEVNATMARGFITTIQPEIKQFDLWITEIDGTKVGARFKIEFNEPTTGVAIYKAWKQKKPFIIFDLKGAQVDQWLDYLAKDGFHIAKNIRGTRRVNTFIYYSQGFIGITSSLPLAEENIVMLQRFAKVFDQTYTRFLDLQTAEAAAKEAIKQAALDRIRADIASMRTKEDLNRITPLIWNELTILGIPFIRCGVFMMDQEAARIHTYLSTPTGEAIAAFHLSFEEFENIKNVVHHWRTKQAYINHWGRNEFAELAESLIKQGSITNKEQYLQSLPATGIHLNFIPFLQGMLYVGNTAPLPTDDIHLLQSVADAFATAYARYEDFNKLEVAKQVVEKTLEELKATQKQLVQSEKMASLGELTAGIAHEIQNPLNFVNNFSELNVELLEELQAEMRPLLAEGEVGVTALIDDIKTNSEKINHHGKRADGIVKGMLQHSRSSTGQKEPTDINALCDEYLRLAYHGLRAKDKTFNAEFKTEFDEAIGKVNVQPQEMGRVILNLINNAFYACTERSRSAAQLRDTSYEPRVTVRTKQIPNPANPQTRNIAIAITDNGTGIPQHIKEKIFQPFFTTKPTGQGTGLGLSLAYDIVTKVHSGKLEVDSEEGKGTTFIVTIPV